MDQSILEGTASLQERIAQLEAENDAHRKREEDLRTREKTVAMTAASTSPISIGRLDTLCTHLESEKTKLEAVIARLQERLAKYEASASSTSATSHRREKRPLDHPTSIEAKRRHSIHPQGMDLDSDVTAAAATSSGKAGSLGLETDQQDCQADLAL